jgi:hypothetical protein
VGHSLAQDDILFWSIFSAWAEDGRHHLLGFFAKYVLKFEQNRRKPEKTCGNRRNAVDKASGKAEGELRNGSPHPHEH